ncbi:hypothetical protein NE235_18830 [Actinoallomurus spadix]|uniref:Uncharacterized protein n=1 Tax=Actinoallomurus spadix TaxID=79912 RepID=A0ABN0W038_9ACTN|nr:hypothetical protein [Actinoallomurus spadix]MCO5988161.1 hypothetical protein [Actinoallomurus spadix]
MTVKKKGAPARKADAGRASDKQKSWFKSLSAWTKTALIGPIAVTVLGAAILKVVGLTDGGGSTPATSTGLKLEPKAPAMMINRIGIEHLESAASMATGTVINAAVVDRLNAAGTNVYSEAGDERLRALGAANVNVETATLAVTGNRKNLVRITDIRALAQCEARLTGTLFFSPTAGESHSAKIGFDLDKPNPVAQNVVDKGAGPEFVGNYFPDHEYDLAPGEPTTFVLTARTTKYHCRYRYQFELLVDGKPATQIVDYHGRPFEVTAQAYTYSTAQHDSDFSAYQALYVTPFVADLSPAVTTVHEGGWSSADPAHFTF